MMPVNQATDVTSRSAAWQLQLGALGAVLEGVRATDQLIRMIVETQLGSVPGRPGFGIDWFKIKDKPLSVAGPIVVREATVALGLWARGVNILRIVPALGELGQMQVDIIWRPAGEAERTVEVRP